jgi:hypothetical protein
MSDKRAACLHHLQLFVGWVVLFACTFSLSLVPTAARLWKFSRGDVFNQSVSSSSSLSFTLFGEWVLVEFLLLAVLYGIATTIMYCCRPAPPNAG